MARYEKMKNVDETAPIKVGDLVEISKGQLIEVAEVYPDNEPGCVSYPDRYVRADGSWWNPCDFHSVWMKL